MTIAAPLPLIALAVAVVILAALAVLQALLAAGRPLGRFAWGGQHDVLPQRLRVASAASIVLYAGMAAVLASRAAVLPGGDTGFITVATWVLVGYFSLGIVVNAISRSRDERRTMVPVCILLAATTLVIALAPR